MNMQQLERYAAEMRRMGRPRKAVVCSWCEEEFFDCSTPRWHAMICTILGRAYHKIKEV